MNLRPHTHRSTAGFMLLEVLIALMIFALGVLGLVGLQSAAVRQSSQAKYRADASLLANELIGTMWVDNRSFANLQNNYASATAGAKYQIWLTKVKAALPGATANPPVVTIVQIQPLAAIDPTAPLMTPSSRVSITMNWKTPNEPAGDPPHALVMMTQIK